MNNELFDFDDLKDLDLDDIMQLTIGQIADAQKFVLPPRGIYKLKLDIEMGTMGSGDKETKCISATWTILQTIELLDAEVDVPIPEGTEFSQNWGGGGVTFFKTNLAPLGLQLGATETTTLAQLLEILSGKEYVGTVTHRDDKNKVDEKGKKITYPGVVDLSVVM
jgi:hypothetical protein